MQQRKSNKKSDKNARPSVKILWMIVWIGFALFTLTLAAANFGLFGKLPSLQELENPQANLASEIYANDGTTLMGKIYAENRVSVDYKNISKDVIDALISTEDERFYDHSGIDARSIGRAVYGLGRDGGGSTITQQLAKNILGQGRGSVVKRGIDKLKEWIVALKLEKNFTKEEIIALYLNRVSWLNVYGIRNAARVYFQKEPSQLTTDESALLVGMLKGPGQYDPIRHPDAALARRNTVLDQMVRNDVITESAATMFKKKSLGIKYKKLDENMGIAPYFRTVLAKKLDDWCKNHKDPKTGNNYDLYRDGLKIYTTIDPKMQLYAEEAVVKHMTSMQKTFNRQLPKNVWKGEEDILNRAMKESDRWKYMKESGATDEEIKKSFHVPVSMKVFAWNAKRETDTVMTPLDSIKYFKQMMQTAFCAMDPVNGEVKAWVGGIDFKWFKFDHVTTTRQVGSTFKPILYTLAITDAGLTPDSYIGGKAITLANKTISGAGGTMAYCLAKSLNSAAYDLMSRIGPKKTAEFAHLCGIKSNIPIVPSIALGSADIQLIEMLRAYTMFPNRGFNTEPVYLNRIEDRNGNVLQTFQTESKQVISEVDAYTMYRMMQGVVDFGTGHSMRDKFGIQSFMGGKTGTTNDNTDGWFIGYTPQLLAGAWVGCDDPFLHIGWTSGGNEMAMPEFAYFMQKVYADKKLGIDPKATFEKPAELNNDPIFADQNFAAIAQKGQGTDFTEDQGNGNAGDYGAPTNVPVESDFGTADSKSKTEPIADEKKFVGPENFTPAKKDTLKNSAKKNEEKNAGKKLNKNESAINKESEKNKKPAKSNNDY
ncbi:MAG: transglycosylase domain-containing protein [Bacteroidota bacterium]|nr:transglycosylase domain-containing protein [Bacteroidota bacterium]